MFLFLLQQFHRMRTRSRSFGAFVAAEKNKHHFDLGVRRVRFEVGLAGSPRELHVDVVLLLHVDAVLLLVQVLQDPFLRSFQKWRTSGARLDLARSETRRLGDWARW